MDAHQIPVRFADLNHAQQLATQLKGCHALLNVASIGFGAAPSILEACLSAAVRRAVFVSTTAIFTQLHAGSKVVRKAAEAAITSSVLDTTILRPTMIYGTPGDRNMIRLVRWLDRWPVLPVFGNGRSLQQPVHVSDVAWAVVQALETPVTIGRQFNISGAAPLTQRHSVSTMTLGRYLLYAYPKPIVSFLQTIDDLVQCQLRPSGCSPEDKAFSHAGYDCFRFSPMAFEQGITQEVALLRSGSDGLS